MKKCIIFDKDGVLVNTEPLHFRVWQQVFREKGLELSYECYRPVIGSTRMYLCDLIENWYGRSFHNDPELGPRFLEVYREIIAEEGIPRVEGVQEVVRYLYEKGYALGVASSSQQPQIESDLTEVGIASYFTTLFSGEKVAHPKPAPDVFLAVAARMGYQPEECVVVEDSKNGTLAAKAAGMQCLGFANPDSGNQDLSAADRIFYKFEELKEIL